MLHKDDFDDVDTPLQSDLVLTLIANMLAGIGIFVVGIGLWLWWML